MNMNDLLSHAPKISGTNNNQLSKYEYPASVYGMGVGDVAVI